MSSSKPALKSPSKTRRGQRGAALVLVLLILAVLASLSVSLLDTVGFQRQRLLNQQDFSQALWYAQGGEAVVTAALVADAEATTSHLKQNWARSDVVFPLDGGSLEGKVRDLQACLNLNSLYSLDRLENATSGNWAQSVLTRLFSDIGLSEVYAAELGDAMQDWIDSDSNVEGAYGAEDTSHLTGVVSQWVANTWLASSDLLPLLVAWPEDEQAQVKPFLCALPTANSGVNINTLTATQAPLLAALMGEAVTTASAEALIEERPDEGWASVDELLASPSLQGLDFSSLDKRGFAVKSDFFASEIDVFLNGVSLRLLSRYDARQELPRVYARSLAEVSPKALGSTPENDADLAPSVGGIGGNSDLEGRL